MTRVLVVEDEQLRVNGVVKATGDPGDDYPLTIDSPIWLDGEDKVVRRAPKIGEHSREVLGELGYTAARIDQLVQSRVVGAPENP